MTTYDEGIAEIGALIKALGNTGHNVAVWGRPGCGKTLSIKASGYDLSNETKDDPWVLIDGSWWGERRRRDFRERKYVIVMEVDWNDADKIPADFFIVDVEKILRRVTKEVKQ